MDSYEEDIPEISQYLIETPKIKCSSHIEKTYANKNELNELLKQWNMEDLIEYFIEQQLYVEVLKHLDVQTAKHLFCKSNLSLGAQIEFLYHWSKWKKNTENLTAENNDSSTLEAAISNLKLGTILNSNPYGLSVLKFYESNSCLNDNSRKLLCDSVIHFCIEKGHALTVKDSENLAKQIVQTFSGEEAAYYHITRQNASPLGKLYNKYRNWKSSINKKGKNDNGSETKQATKTREETKLIADFKDSQGNEEGHLRVLKHEFNIMSYEEILIHWNGCFEIRQKSFKELCAPDSKKHLVDLWPMLKDSKGFRLINNDYERIYGNPNIFLDTFDVFSNLMISKVFPNFVSKFKGEYEMKIWQFVHENNCIENTWHNNTERNDLSYPPVISTLSPLGHAADFLAPGDRLHQIDGISTIGLTNQHIMSMLCGGGSADGPAIVEIEYSLPEYISQNSLCVTSKLAQITVERESGCLGLTLRGGADYPLIVTHVRPHGPVYKTGRIKPGDRLLRVDNVSLIGKTLAEAQQIIKCGGHISGYTNLTIEYDVSVVQSVEFSMGPLLIEIERPMNDKLGLVLCNYTSAAGLTDHTKIDEVSQAGVYIASILPASIADRCGALTVGDQVLSIDDINVENSTYTPDEVMTILDTSSGRGYTQMQIMPAHALARRGHTTLNSPKYGFNTLESRKSRQRQRFVRKSSLPLETANAASTSAASAAGSSGSVSGPSSSVSGSSLGASATSSSTTSGLHHTTNMGICRAETFPVLLDCSMGSGLVLGQQTPCGRAVTIAKIIPDSVADRCGCIQKGDRIVAINKMYNLEQQTMRQLLGDMGSRPPHSPANWLELEIEFDMPDTVVPSSGVFNVKVLRIGKAGLGLSVNGSSHGGFVISDVKPGSPAHRTGSLRSGDIILAVDNHPVQHFNVDSLLKEGSLGDFSTLTIKRVMLPDFLFDAQQKVPNHIYSNCPNSPTTDHDLYSSAYVAKQYAEIKYNDCLSLKSATPQPEYFRGPTLDDNTLTSVQIRHHLNAPNWNNTATMGRSFNNQNTQSLTTELPEDEHNYNEFGGYDLDRYASVDCTTLPPPMENKVYGSAASSSSKSSATSLHQIIFTVRLEPKGGLLGITLAGSEDISKPITISGIVEGGIAHKNGQIQVGDQLLAINTDSIQGMPLSNATNLLQSLGDIVDLKILRSHDLQNNFGSGTESTNMPQPQAIYAKVQRRPRSPSTNTENDSTNGKAEKQRIFPVTLYKDKVYDDYGFSVSDGLYERGVFINRIRTGGPADKCGKLKPFDRIMQVNEMKTQEFDCCLTVPLIAAAGDKIEMIIQRTE